MPMVVRDSLMHSVLKREADRHVRLIDSQIAWLAAFGALGNRHVKDGLRGAIVGAPADPEAFG